MNVVSSRRGSGGDLTLCGFN